MTQSKKQLLLWEDISVLIGLVNNKYPAFEMKSNLDFYLHHPTQLSSRGFTF